MDSLDVSSLGMDCGALKGLGGEHWDVGVVLQVVRFVLLAS
jgi:hypothetical protein